MGGVSEHSRVLAEAAAARGLDVHVWTAAWRALTGDAPVSHVHPRSAPSRADDLEKTGRCSTVSGAAEICSAMGAARVRPSRHESPLRAWLARRAATGDRLDVMVHEPFVDFFGGSWIQPARAVVQRTMTRTVLGAARRVWLSIPGWEERLLPMLPAAVTPRVLPVPGTIPVDRRSARDRESARRGCSVAGRAVVGYFGTGGAYVEPALAETIREHRRDATRRHVRLDRTRQRGAVGRDA